MNIRVTLSQLSLLMICSNNVISLGVPRPYVMTEGYHYIGGSPFLYVNNTSAKKCYKTACYNGCLSAILCHYVCG